MSRGLRNNNPGNIRRSRVRYKGEVPSADQAFKSFYTMEWGYRAMFVLLHTYRLRHRLDTLEKMLDRYAPPEENDTRGYVAFVATRSGVDPGKPVDTLNGEQMRAIVSAMSRMENGADASLAEVQRGWELFIAGVQ